MSPSQSFWALGAKVLFPTSLALLLFAALHWDATALHPSKTTRFLLDQTDWQVTYLAGFLAMQATLRGPRSAAIIRYASVNIKILTIWCASGLALALLAVWVIASVVLKHPFGVSRYRH